MPRNPEIRTSSKKIIRQRTKEIAIWSLPETIAGGFLYRRFHVNPAIADLLAQCAGLGPQEARR